MISKEYYALAMILANTIILEKYALPKNDNPSKEFYDNDL